MIGKHIRLVPMTREQCHAFYQVYVSDPMMTGVPYVYDKNQMDLYYDQKILAKDRRIFSIMKGETVIGEIQLKAIDKRKREATLSIILSCDAFKNKGYGTEAEQLLIDYGFQVLDLLKIKADTVKRNKRSRHILEKLGFHYVGEDDILVYFELNR